MTTDQSPHVDRVDGEIVVDSTAEEPVIPAQRGAPAGQSAAPKRGLLRRWRAGSGKLG
jgi:hypothetical protein